MFAPDLTDAVWRKSSYSNGNMNCVEVTFAWRKSSYSNGELNCVEVARADRITAVRDSKHPAGPVLSAGPLAWQRLLGVLNP